MKPVLWLCILLGAFHTHLLHAETQPSTHAFLITQPSQKSSAYQWVKHALIETLDTHTQHGVEEPGVSHAFAQENLQVSQLLQEHMQKAVLASNNLDYEEAHTQYQKALLAAEKKALLTNNMHPLRNVLYALSSVLILLKDVPGYTETIQRIAVLDPDFSPKAPLFNPEMQHTFNTVMASALQQPTQFLQIECPLEACAVHINAHFIGLTPLEKISLLPGTYYVAVSAPYHLTYTYEVKIENTPYTLKAQPNPIMYQNLVERSLAPVFSSPTPETLPPSVKEIIPTYITHVYVLDFNPPQFSLSTYHLSSGIFTQQHAATIPETPGQARLVAQQLLIPPPAVQSPPVPQPSPNPTLPLVEKKLTHPYKSAWVYSAYAFGAAATLSAIGLGARAIWLSEQYTHPQTSQLAGERYRSEGYKLAVATDVLLPLGILSLCTGLSLQYLWHPER